MSRAVTAQRLLQAWEATLEEQNARRGVALLACCRDADVDALSRWGLTERDAALFDLRHVLFGTEAVAVTECAGCGEHLEVRLDLSMLRPATPAGDSTTATIDGYTVRTRTPCTDDLAAISAYDDETSALSALVTRCVESVHSPSGVDVPLTDVPAGVTDEVRRHVADRVDDIDAELSLTCAGCGTTSMVSFDIAAFLLREVEVWAARVLREVHVLARAYGWDEPTILHLSPRRRRAYIDLVEAAP